jgi:hypothetical protein
MTIGINSCTASGQDSPGVTFTFPHTVNAASSNQMLVVGVSIEHGAGPDFSTGATYAGESMTALTRICQGGYSGGGGFGTTGEFYYLLNPTTGTNNVEVSLGTYRDYCISLAADFHNVEQSAPSNYMSGNSGGSVQQISGQITPASSNNICISVAGFGGTNDIYPLWGDETECGQDSTTQNCAAMSYEVNGDTGGEWMGWKQDGAAQRFSIVNATWNEYQAPTASTTFNPDDLLLYYSPFSGSAYISCNCSRWDQQNKTITVETWLKKPQLQTLRNNITPGAVRMLYKVLDDPIYYDTTWTASNTIKLYPNENALDIMRSPVLMIIKTIQDNPISGPSGYLHVKLSGYISGAGLI